MSAGAANQGIPKIIAGTPLPTGDYGAELNSGTGLNGSWNWTILGCAADGWNRKIGAPALWSYTAIRQWVVFFFTKQLAVGHQGHEWRSGIYTRYFVTSIRALRALAKLLGWADVIARADNWLRIHLFWSALLAQKVAPKDPSEAEATRFGPGVKTADQPTTLPGTWAVADCGHRSYSSKNPGAIFLAFHNSSERNIAEACGLRPRDPLTAALLGKGYAADWPITKSEAILLAAAAGGDVDALCRVAAMPEVAAQPILEPYVVIVTTGGKQSVMLDFSGSSTAPTYSKRVDADGTVYILTADSGGRSSSGGDDDVRRGSASIDWNARKVTCRRDDGVGGIQSLDFPPGEVVFVFEHDGTTGRVTTPKPQSAPAPAPPPGPAAQERQGGCLLTRWLKRSS